MIMSRRVRVALAAAAAAVAIGVSVPTSAADLSAPGQAAEQAQTVRTAMPVPKARPMVVRKRVAARYRFLGMRPWIARPAPPPLAPVARLAAAHWPMLLLGIGF
jgi:hypothetical protein